MAKEVDLMHENSGYDFAELKNICYNDISNLEKKMSKDNGKEIILLAFEKSH